MERKFVGVIILSIVVLGFVAYILIGELMPKIIVRERPTLFIAVVRSSSMEPTIKPGATVTYEEVPFESLKVDDIIVFKKPGSDPLVVARIIRVTPEGIETKGDNNPAPDRWKITAEEFVGKVIRIDNP